MKNNLILAFILLIGCKPSTVDIDTISFLDKNIIKNLKVVKKETQKGNWTFNEDMKPVLKGDNISTHYYFRTPEELSQLEYNEFPISDLGAKLVTIDDRLVFARFSLNKDKTFDVFNHLEQKLGVPDQTFDSIGITESNAVEVKLLENNLTKKQGLEKTTDEYDDAILKYPYQNTWIKDNIIYQFTLARSREAFGNTLLIISKQALKDKVIFGYHNPTKDPILGKYLK